MFHGIFHVLYLGLKRSSGASQLKKKYSRIKTNIHSTLALRTPRYNGHPAITDTPLLRTGARSPAITTKKCMEITPLLWTPAITELRTLHAVPHEHLYCFTLVTTDTLDVLNEYSSLCQLSTLKIGSFHKLQPDFPLWHNPLFSKTKKQFYSNRVIFIAPRYCGLSLLQTPNDGPEGVHYNET